MSARHFSLFFLFYPNQRLVVSLARPPTSIQRVISRLAGPGHDLIIQVWEGERERESQSYKRIWCTQLTWYKTYSHLLIGLKVNFLFSTFVCLCESSLHLEAGPVTLREDSLFGPKTGWVSELVSLFSLLKRAYKSESSFTKKQETQLRWKLFLWCCTHIFFPADVDLSCFGLHFRQLMRWALEKVWRVKAGRGMLIAQEEKRKNQEERERRNPKNMSQSHLIRREESYFCPPGPRGEGEEVAKNNKKGPLVRWHLFLWL